MTMGYMNNIVLQLAAASDNAISLSQTPGGAGNLTITGSLATAGVATMDVPRRVLLTFAADETGHNFTITGTDRYGRAQSEVVAGTTAGTAYTARDFKTVTQIAISAAATGAVKAGTNGIGSSAPVVMDCIANPSSYGAAVSVTGTANYSVEQAYDDFSPEWDLNTNLPTWYPADGFSQQDGNVNGTIQGPATLTRLTVNSGTGSVALKLIQPMIAGRF